MFSPDNQQLVIMLYIKKKKPSLNELQPPSEMLSSWNKKIN